MIRYDQSLLFRLTGSLAIGNSPVLSSNLPIGDPSNSTIISIGLSSSALVCNNSSITTIMIMMIICIVRYAETGNNVYMYYFTQVSWVFL